MQQTADTIPPDLWPADPPADQRTGGDGDNRAVEVSILEPDGAMFSARIDLPDDTAPGYVAAALLSALRGVAHTHSRMMAALVQDALDAAARVQQEEESSRLTVARLDEMARQHMLVEGHHPHLLEVPGIGSVPFATVRAVLAMAGNL